MIHLLNVGGFGGIWIYQIIKKMKEQEDMVKAKNEDIYEKHEQEKKPYIPRKRWTLEEELVYVEFLKENKKSLEKKKQRWVEKIFQQLSYALGKTRNSVQCHAHHEASLKKYGNIDDIIRLKLLEGQKKSKVQPSDELPDLEVHIIQQLYQIQAKRSKIKIIADLSNIEEW